MPPATAASIPNVALEEDSPEVLSLKLKVANQRLQLRQQNDSFWRKRHANRVLRQKVDELSARLKEIDSEWYDEWRGAPKA